MFIIIPWIRGSMIYKFYHNSHELQEYWQPECFKNIKNTSILIKTLKQIISNYIISFNYKDEIIGQNGVWVCLGHRNKVFSSCSTIIGIAYHPPVCLHWKHHIPNLIQDVQIGLALKW